MRTTCPGWERTHFLKFWGFHSDTPIFKRLKWFETWLLYQAKSSLGYTVSTPFEQERKSYMQNGYWTFSLCCTLLFPHFPSIAPLAHVFEHFWRIKREERVVLGFSVTEEETWIKPKCKCFHLVYYHIYFGMVTVSPSAERMLATTWWSLACSWMFRWRMLLKHFTRWGLKVL